MKYIEQDPAEHILEKHPTGLVLNFAQVILAEAQKGVILGRSAHLQRRMDYPIISFEFMLDLAEKYVRQIYEGDVCTICRDDFLDRQAEGFREDRLLEDRI